MSEFIAVEAGERSPQRLRRKALDLADEAIARLDQISSEGQTAIHDVRRRLKELRALTDLIGSALPQGGQPESHLFRDAGRQLSAARDAKAVLETFDRLREHYASDWTPRQFMKIRRALAGRVTQRVDPEIIERLRAALTVERGKIAAWTVDEMSRDELWRAIKRSYRRARRAMRAALEERTAEVIHLWRRLTKMHWYHAQFFVSVGLAPVEEHAESLRKLSRVLGDHHDLVVLDELCQQSPELFGSARYVRKFRRFIAQRLRQLEGKAESAGGDLFAERAKSWEERVKLMSEPPGGHLRVGPKKSPSRASTRSRAITA